MRDIIDLVSSPVFWITNIFIAILVNLASDYISNSLRRHIPRRIPAGGPVYFLTVIHTGLICVAAAYLIMTYLAFISQFGRKDIWTLGVSLAVLGFIIATGVCSTRATFALRSRTAAATGSLTVFTLLFSYTLTLPDDYNWVLALEYVLYAMACSTLSHGLELTVLVWKERSTVLPWTSVRA